MVKVDLITGFLGSGKTTFLKRYARYWLDQGAKIAILENDFGAVNVDMLLLQDLESDRCILEMVAGGCCARDHRRRFHTKLIALAMNGVDRVLIEPSGIFDVDEFFDSLHDEPLDRWYEIGNVLAVVDARLEDTLLRKSEYLLASQIADAGSIILSKTDGVSREQIHGLFQHLERAMKQFHCSRKLKEEELITKDWDSWSKEDMARVASAGYRLEDFVKLGNNLNHDYQSVYILKGDVNREKAEAWARELFTHRDIYGSVFRVKGFFCEDGEWLEMNATPSETNIQSIPNGQEVLIVIGDDLQEEAIKACI